MPEDVHDSVPDPLGRSLRDDEGRIPAEDDLVSRIRGIWESYRALGLEARWEVGRILNEALGPPEGRQPYGRRVLERLRDELGIGASESNRMRWFARLFGSVEDLRSREPQLTNWTRLREELPRLRAGHRGTAPAPPRRRRDGRRSRSAHRIEVRLRRTLSDLQAEAPALDDYGRRRLRSAVAELLEVAGRLGLVETVDDAYGPAVVRVREAAATADRDGSPAPSGRA